MIVFPSWKQDLDSYLNQALTNRLFQLECEENKNNEIIKFTNLQISHSSEVIAYISNENEVKVFSLQEKNLVWSLSPRKKNEKFTCLQFNPKSNNIYVASNVYGIKQYDISTGGIIDEYPVDEGKYCVSFQCSKTGQYLIAALDNGSLVAYHAKKPENLLLLDSGHSHVNSLAITGQEQVILTVSTQELKIWTFPSFKQMFEPTTLEDCTEGVTIKVSDSEKYLLLNCGDHSMNIYNLETLELLYRIEDEERLRIVDFSLTHDDQILIMLASDSSVIFHDFHANQEITRLKTLKYNDPMGLVVSPDLKFFAVASSKGSLIGYELLSSIDVVEEHNVCQNRTVIGICLTHNQKYLIAAEENGTITIYDTNKQRMLACYENKVQERIRSLALSADDKYLVIGGENKMFIVFRLDASGQNVQLIKEYESQKLPDVIVKLAVIAANGFVVAELKSGDIQAFQLATKEIIMINNSRLNSSHHNYGRIKAMKQGPGLIFGNDKGHIKIINLLTRKMTHEFRNLVSTPISAIGVSGTLIAVGASDPMIALIRLDHRTVEHILTHQEIATFRSLNFSSDESYLVAATASLVTIYETGRGRQLYSFKVDTEILEAKFFQGTTHIITSHFDGVAKVHKIPFLNEISVIDLSLKVPYGTMSKIPGYKLRRMWNNEIDITPQVIQSFAKSYTLPFKINFWYYYFLTQQSMQEPSVITNWIIDADIPVLTDMDKLNIIYYLVKSNEITSLNTVFRRAEEALDDSPPSVFTSLSDVMDDIIASKVPQLANFLEVCVGQPEVSEQKLLKLGDTDGMPLYVFSNERKLTTKILNTLVKDGADPLVFYTSKVQLDPNFFSPKNLKIFEAVFRNENLEIYRSKLVRKLIDAAWLKARPSLWAKAILDVGFLVLLSIYASSKVDSTPDPWVVNFMYGYNSLLLTYEICQFIGNSKLYIRSVLNLLDLVRIALIYATLINSNASVDDYSNGDASSANDGATSPKVAGVVIFAIFFNYLKLITHFRLLKPARKLIRMVVETITDMITFTLFFGLITFGLAFMIYLSGILFTNRTAISLGNAIGNVYSIALGQFDVDGYDALDWGLFVLSTFLLAIVLLPLLISIINNTFTEGRKNAIPNEYIEKLDLILESAATQKGLKRLLLLVRKERPPPKVVGSMVGSRDLGSSRDLSSSRDLRSGHPKKYLFWVDEVHAEGENEKEATWETGIRDVRKDVELNVKKHNADIIKKIGLIAKALGTLTETKKEAWKLYCKEQKLSEKAMSDYIIAKRDLHILKRKLDMADEESFEDNDISSELSLEDDGRHFVSEERFISRPKKSGRKTIF